MVPVLTCRYFTRLPEAKVPYIHMHEPGHTEPHFDVQDFKSVSRIRGRVAPNLMGSYEVPLEREEGGVMYWNCSEQLNVHMSWAKGCVGNTKGSVRDQMRVNRRRLR